MPISPQLNQRSVLALVACDFSYVTEIDLQSELAKGNPVPLTTLQDSTPEENRFPRSLADSAGLVVRHEQVRGNTELAFGDWIFKDSVYSARTGFGAVFFYSEERREYIIAATGTNGLDAQDWYNNLNLATTQWDDSRNLVADRFRELAARDAAFSSAHVTFAGQSLGGALAQFAAYDFVQQNPTFQRANVSVITFNGLGAFGGMRQMQPGFDEGLLAGAETAHYAVFNDIVHRLGDGNFNASNNTYLLDFRAVPGQAAALGIVDAHRLESGFYRGFDWPNVSLVARDLGWGSFQTAAKLYDIDYLNTTEAQRLAAGFAQLFNDGDHSTFESAARMVAGITHGLRHVPFGETQAVSEQFVEHYRRTIPSSEPGVLWFAAGLAIPAALKAAVSLPPATAATIYSLLLGIGWDLAEELTGHDASMPERLARLLPADEYDLGLAKSIVDEPDLAHSMFKTLLGFKIADGSILNGGTSFDASQVLGSAFTNADWLHRTLRLLAERARDSGVSVPAVAVAMVDETVALANALGASAGGLVDDVVSDVSVFIDDLGKSIANAHQDLVTKIVDTTFDLRRALGFDEGRSLLEDLKKGLQSGGAVQEAFESAIETIEFAAQTVVVQSGRSSNPFDETSFDPDASPLALGQLKEASVETVTAYLPYEAGEGGQRIRLELAGSAVDRLSVFTEEGDVELDAGGGFTLTVAEGQREVTFHFAAVEDVDADETLTLSAQLVDENDVATHLEHDELTLALDAEVEEAPVGGMELHGDWGLKLYPVFNQDGTPIMDANGNQVFETRFDTRYPPFTNLERDLNGRVDFGEQGALLTGLDGPDHIWLGEFGGAGGAIGGGGDDYFEGKSDVPNLIIGDYSSNGLGASGNDVIEGGENARPYSSPGFTREGEHIEGIGDDILFGGLGNDEIYADRILLLDETLDPDAVVLDQKGDWITGEQGDDRIFGSAAHDALFGGGGADEIHGGVGNDVLDGDDNYYNWGDAWWEIEAGSFGVTFFPVTNFQNGALFEYYKDHGGDDVLDGGSGDDLIFGMLGNDTLIGGAGEDQLEGWEGDDRLFGGADDDTLAGDFGRNEISSLRRPSGEYHVMPGGWSMSGSPGTANQVGKDLLDGGDGDDRLIGEASDDILLGGDGADSLIGDANYLPQELHGNDLLDGGAGPDELSGDGGDDRLFGGADADVLRGDAGSDQLDGGSGEDSLAGDDGDDLLEGEAGDDLLAGDAGSDELHGGDGSDRLSGSEGDDVLHGDAGNDELDGGYGADALGGGSGDDVIYGGEGDDVIEGGAGADTVLGGAGDDTYVVGFGSGQDVIEDSSGNNRLRFAAGVAPESLSAILDNETLALTIALGAAGDSVTLSLDSFVSAGADFASGESWGKEELLGFVPARVWTGSEADDELEGSEYVRNDLRGLGGDDSLAGSANDDRLDGGDGADFLDGRDGNDALYGNDGEDNLEGGYGDDVLAGGRGDEDALVGGEGADTYVFAAGDGADFVFEFDQTPGETDTLLLSGIVAEGVRVTRDEWSYYLVLGDGDRVTLDSMAMDQAAEVERIDFADGTTWTPADLAARVELLPGTELNDALWGTPDDDVLSGLGGEDVIYGNRGNDLLIGGQGSDHYYFGAGDGADRIDSSESDLDTWDQVSFADLASGDAMLARSGGDLIVHVGDGDSVTLIDWYTAPQRRVDEVIFEIDGVSWDMAMLEQLAPAGGGNAAPELAQPVDDQTADEDAPFGFTVPGGTFDDADVLTYAADFGGGWLSFDPASRAFSGTPTNDDVGIVEVTLTATDPFGESASDAFRIEVRNTNDAPVAAEDAADIMENAATVSGNVLANDVDVDGGDTLVAGAGMYAGVYGSLQLEQDGSFVYALDSAAAQSLAAGQSATEVFAYRVTDGALAVDGQLVISINGANDAPGVSGPLGSQSAREGQPFTFSIPAGAFTDVDAGDHLRLSAELADGSALPGWLRLEGGQLTATPGLGDGGDYELRVVATDMAGASASATLNLTVTDSLAIGNLLIGTPGDDMLNGTAAAEVLLGRGGADRLAAGDGDDILGFFPDERIRGENRSRDRFDGGPGFDTLVGTAGHDVLQLDAAPGGVRLAGIEYIAMRAGHDLVDLRSSGNTYGEVILDGGMGHDVLRASGGDDVLLGRSGNDELSGGAGWDVYVHERLGGHDRISESGAEGEIDVLRFGDGITRSMVRARRQGDDLQLDLSGANGSITVEDWFSRGSQRVELVQFADGFAWDEDDIAQLARRSRFGDGDRLGREGGADAMEIARQWAAVKRHADALALGAEDLDEAGDWQPVSIGAFVDAHRRRSAFEAAQATEGFRSLEAQ